jgi:large subunit ribosomal protein L23
MTDPRKILLKPMLTEKSTKMKEGSNTFVFKVHQRANKIEIKRAVQKLFNVQVVDVRTMLIQGKTKRMGRFEGRRPNWKKALITLRQGETIDFFETK